MTIHVLRLYCDWLGARAALSRPLPAENRVIYVADGMATVSAGGAVVTLAPNSAMFSAAEITIAAGPDGARLLRYELVSGPEPEPGNGIANGANIRTDDLIDAALTLDDPGGYLMRCDRVDLPPGGIAYTHTHRGAGIRCLLDGGFNVTVHGKTTKIAPGEAWFEAGPDPVLAWAPDDRPGQFSRVMILPRALKGKSSISYVNPEDADKPKPQHYTIFVDELIDP